MIGNVRDWPLASGILRSSDEKREEAVVVYLHIHAVCAREGHDLWIVSPEMIASHLLQVVLIGGICLVLGCTGKGDGRRGRAGVLPLRVASFAINGEERFEHIGILSHVRDYICADLVVGFLMAVDLIGQG